MRIRNSAKALIIRDDCLLVVRMRDDDGDFYILPDGGREPAEPLNDAIRQERREELRILHCVQNDK